MAARLGLSERTIETYVRRLFAKLHVCSRSEVAARFVNHLSK
ncbi:LuxR C-terminal-related transcriptional regulator [Actinomyces gerencseriae]